MKLKRLMAAMTFVAAGVATANAVAAVDPAIPSYTKTTGVSGNLSSVGSDTLANLMTLWAENYKKEYPNVNIQIQAAGSATAPPALTEGTSNLGPMSRKMKDTELAGLRAEVRLQANRYPGCRGRPGGVRAQGQPDPAPDHGTGRRDLLLDSSVRR